MELRSQISIPNTGA